MEESSNSPPFTPRSPSARAAVAASQDRLGSIMDFLDKVEANTDEKEGGIGSEREGNNNADEANAENGTERLKNEDVNADLKEEQTGFKPAEKQTYEGVKMKIVALEMEVAEQAKVMELLKTTLKEERRKKQVFTAKAKEHERQRLEKLGKEYEAAVKKQMNFANRLLKDKEELSTKCAELAQEIQGTEQKLLKRLTDQKDEFTAEMKRKRDAWQQAERIRRENLIQQMTEDIKARTIKGLEPEIQRMMNDHRQETQKLKEIHEQELLVQKSVLADDHERELVDVQNTLLRNQAETVETQVQVMRHKMLEERKKLMEEFEKERKTMSEDHGSELRARDERLAGEHRSFMEEVERVQYESQARLTNQRDEFDRQMERQEQKHKEKLDEQKRDLFAAQNVWKKETGNALRDEFEKKQRVFEEDVQKQRDEDIDMIIQKLDGESVEAKQKIEQRYKNQVAIMQKKFDADLDAVKQSRDDWAARAQEGIRSQREGEDRLNKARIERGKYEDMVSAMKAKVSELERKNSGLEKKLTLFEKEMNAEHESEINEMNRQIQRIESELNDMGTEMERKEEGHSREIADLSKQNEKELNMINERVRVIVARKDTQIEELKEQLTMSEAKTKHAEALLDKQREQFLKM